MDWAVPAAGGAVITLAVGWVSRGLIGPWFIRPAVSHARDAVADLVTDVVMSPAVQREMRPMFEEVVASEARTIMDEQRRQGARIERVEKQLVSLSKAVRGDIKDRSGDAGTQPGA